MNIKITLPLIALMTLVISLPVYAGHGDMGEHTHSQEQSLTSTNISDIKPNQVVMEVHGIVCSFCSRGVKKKLAKFNFIDRALVLLPNLTTVSLTPNTHNYLYNHR